MITLNTFKRSFLFILIIFISAVNGIGQSLQYVENKGQWDSKVTYASDMGGSVFFLQKQGYKVLLNNQQDLKNIAQHYSGHVHDTKNTPGAANQLNSAAANNSSDNLILHSVAYEVKFLGAAANPRIIPDKPLDTYNNYYLGNDSSKWASGCKIFQAITYENVYPGIDARYYADNGSLKYDFIVHPGADVNKIALQFTGVSGISIKNKNLVIKTPLGEVSEERPYTYQFMEKGRADVDASYYIENGNIVKFRLQNYSKTATVVIDPTLIFASFTGSLVDNWGYTATYDGTGNFYAGGIAFGSGFPTSVGAFQTNYSGGVGEGSLGGYDIALIKLSANGSTRLYATYLGGGGNEQPHSLVVDNNDDLIIAGRTNSSNFPTTAATIGSGGKFDIFITKIKSDGSAILGSRKIGGVDDDGVNIRSKEIAGPLSITRNYGDDARSEVIVDQSNNIYLASCTQSSGFPVTAGVFQSSSGGKQDGVLIKMNNSLSNLLFASYLGGNGDDAAFVLSLNPLNNNIYVAGSTVSDNLQGVAGNAGPILFNKFQNGACDGYVSIINNTGTALIKTVYVGTPGNDMLYGIQIDRFGFPYITGATTSAFPVINAAFNTQANGKQFITKLQPDLSGVVYSTNFGKGLSAPDIATNAFLVDRCENVYVAGWGGGLANLEGYPNAGTLGLTTTANAIRANSDGSDFYFFVLEKNALSQLYGTFYGNIDNVPDVGDHVDGGTSRFDKEGVIYQAMCANCNKAGVFPTTPGVWGPTNPANTGAECNEAAVKIAFELAGVGSGIRPTIHGKVRDTSGCLPLTVDFRDTIATGKIFVWSFNDGSPDQTTLVPTISHTFTTTGLFRVRLISIDSLTCNIADTSYTRIRVRDDSAYINFNTLKLPPCQSLNYQFNNISVAPPLKPFNANSFEWSFGDGTTLISNALTLTHAYPAPGTYNVVLRLIDTAYCNYPDSVTIQLRIASNVKAQFETPPSGCVPYTLPINNTSLAGTEFLWDFGDGNTFSGQQPVYTYFIPGTYTIKLVVIDSNTCNIIDSTQQTITVSAKPIAIFTYSPQPSEENTPTIFTNFSLGGISYKWKFGDGDSLVTTNRDSLISHIYAATGTYNACLTTTNQFGCDSTVCQPVQAIIRPVLGVPNAFTPNGDGVNDKIFVKAFGIDKMSWRIYNRWGQLIYTSNSISDGWDGKYNGVLQPQEVYVYVLDVTFTDGTQSRKKGDITLLR
ncbi:DUF7948 domain-containing protein [Limnovirga soli]|uniref:PKD domain-containing protein n=1 Tax=Limnovirga soli TaxID=2656915 RepID=A0A8J8F9K7_9BACT|nr:PKD domain-containing protein [Limnovirga soli]NNV53831.1 PKD domain-containing protein [Limnovirga soli]